MAALSVDPPRAADHAACPRRKRSSAAKMKAQREDPAKTRSTFLLFWLLYFTSVISGTPWFVHYFKKKWKNRLFCTTAASRLAHMLHRMLRRFNENKFMQILCCAKELMAVQWRALCVACWLVRNQRIKSANQSHLQEFLCKCFPRLKKQKQERNDWFGRFMFNLRQSGWRTFKAKLWCHEVW